jgi:hypothetical protein
MQTSENQNLMHASLAANIRRIVGNPYGFAVVKTNRFYAIF